MILVSDKLWRCTLCWAESAILIMESTIIVLTCIMTRDPRQSLHIGRSWLEPRFKWNWASKLHKEFKLFLDLKIVLVHNLSFPVFVFKSQLPNSSLVSYLEYMQHHYCSFTLTIVSISQSSIFFWWTYRKGINNSLQHPIGFTVNSHLAGQSRLF